MENMAKRIHVFFKLNMHDFLRIANIAISSSSGD
jgi:hypothetical protein